MARGSSRSNHNGVYIAQVCMGVSVAILLAIGLVMVYSADSIENIAQGNNPNSSLIKQGICVLAGIIALLLGRQCGFLVRFWPVIVALNVLSYGLLAYTYFFGIDILGAKRWFNLPFIGTFQASEFTKIIVLITITYLLTRYKDVSLSLKAALLWAVGGVLLPLGIVLVIQSDFGSTFICLVGIMAAFWIAGLDKRIFFASIGIVALVAVCAVLLTPYRRARLLSYIGGNTDTSGDGLQTTNSLYAIAQGGLFGVGIGNSTQKYQWLPEAETDFIFPVIVEELGFVGAFIIIVLFLVILVSSLYIALNASDEFGQILAAGLGVMLVFQAYFNIAVALGIAPVTGKTLPFLSKGGTSLVMNCAIIGLILSVAKVSNPEALAQERRNNLQVISGGSPGYASSAGVASAPVYERGSSGSFGSSGSSRSSRTSRSLGSSRSSRSSSSAHSGGRSSASGSRFRATSYRSGGR